MGWDGSGRELDGHEDNGVTMADCTRCELKGGYAMGLCICTDMWWLL